MAKGRNYTKINEAQRRIRGQAEALSDSRARAVIRLVARNEEINRVRPRERELARDIVHNYEGSDEWLLELQRKHADDPGWLPGPSATRTIFDVVEVTEENAA